MLCQLQVTMNHMEKTRLEHNRLLIKQSSLRRPCWKASVRKRFDWLESHSNIKPTSMKREKLQHEIKASTNKIDHTAEKSLHFLCC